MCVGLCMCMLMAKGISHLTLELENVQPIGATFRLLHITRQGNAA